MCVCIYIYIHTSSVPVTDNTVVNKMAECSAFVGITFYCNWEGKNK